MSKKSKCIIIFFVIFLCIIAFWLFSGKNAELRTIKSDKELLKIYDGNTSSGNEILARIVSMPFSFFDSIYWGRGYNSISETSIDRSYSSSSFIDFDIVPATSSASSSTGKSSTSKDYSTTNIQVENVDEADIIKTDGDYIYSISGNKVVISNVTDPKNIKIESSLYLSDGSYPEDLIIYNNKLVVIAARSTSSTTYYSKYLNNQNTLVNIYDITDKNDIKILKRYELYEPYYTSRCIDNKLYVISSGTLRKEDGKIVRAYSEDFLERQIDLKNIKYLKDVKTRKQTLISLVDLNNAESDIDVSSYLIDISNAYVSENGIYLLDQKYEYDYSSPQIRDLFGLKGIFGVFEYDYDYDRNSGYQTEIYKFDIAKDGKVNYSAKNKVEGRTINQYSLDEFNNHLRVALYSQKGARVVVFNENLKQIGASDYVAKGETMYSSRFMGNKAYLVTYKTMDPLFVIDLSNESNPKVLGELHIPGYSTYLHPYDENHIIGIGMETEEVVHRNSWGQVTSTTSKIIGMKMALFDVSNVKNPIQVSQTVIGDRRTTSAILTNPKALLFSKEKQLIAIPVNNYASDFEISSSESSSYSTMINSYVNYSTPYIAEGYFVYSINLEDGFKLKGVITHDATTTTYYSYAPSKLLRGLYIDDILYTVSETAIKASNLDTLELINELKIK